MIIKVSLCNGWMFISELYKVEIKSMTQLKAIQLDINKEFYCMKNCEKKDLDSVYVKVCYLFTKLIGLDKIIVVDSNSIYLLNDEGKTIERIN